jgi:hypothetical protein
MSVEAQYEALLQQTEGSSGSAAAEAKQEDSD